MGARLEAGDPSADAGARLSVSRISAGSGLARWSAVTAQGGSVLRERLWRNRPDPQVLEVTCNDESHFFLLKGRASFSLPAGHYRVEAYRGLFFIPTTAEFDLAAGEDRRITLDLKSWAEESATTGFPATITST